MKEWWRYKEFRKAHALIELAICEIQSVTHSKIFEDNDTNAFYDAQDDLNDVLKNIKKQFCVEDEIKG